MKRILSILLLSLCAVASFASVESLPPKKVIWPFEGYLGKVDRKSAQRGFQVYREVCAVCHGLNHLYYRNLTEIGFSAAEVKQIASEHEVTDGPNDEGEMYQRPALPSDVFAPPYPSEQAARAVNGGAYPVDLSLIIKARPDGANYVYSVLTGYQDAPNDFRVSDGLYYNPYFHGRQVAMPPPLAHGQVEYVDGTKATIEQMSKDVVVFLQWASEPEMESRKSMGLKVMIYLLIFTALFYIAKQRIWVDVK